MIYEVFIPSLESDGYDVTLTVEADNWMMALKSGLAKTGEPDELIRNVMCDIKQDNSIHVTDASSRRVFVLKEVSEEVETGIDDDGRAPTQKINVVNVPALSPVTPAAPQQDFERVPTDLSHQISRDGEPRKTVPLEATPSEQPKVVVEQQQPKVVVEQQQPKVVVEQPKVVVEQPKVVVEQPKVVVEQEKPKVVVEQPKVVVEQQEPSRSFETGGNWADESGRVRIGSSTMKALRREEPEPRVLEEKRSPTGERKALPTDLRPERVSDNIMEEVFLETNRIHDGEMTMEEVVNFIMDLSLEKVGAEAGSIMFADVNGRELYFATARGPKAADIMSFRIPMGKGIAGFCTREGVSLAISDAPNDPRFYREISDALGYPTKSLCCAPIQFEGRVFGAIELLNSEDNHFNSTELNVLTYVGKQLARYVHELIMASEKLE